MADSAEQEQEDLFRAEAARLVQVMRHHLPASHVPAELAPIAARGRHLAALLEADVPTEHLEEAALAVVDSYDWPSPDASGGGEGPVIDAAVLAAVERLRYALDALDDAS
jgi:hypothetical protein